MAGAGVVSESIDRGGQQEQTLMHCAVRVGIELRQLRGGGHADSGKSTGQRDREVARHRVVTQKFCQNVPGGGFVEFLASADL